MKEKEEIRQEIYELAEKILKRHPDDLLYEISRELYEKSVLLKHSGNLSQQIIAKESQDINTAIAKPEKPETQPTIVEKKQIAVDLFSSENVNPEITTLPVTEKSAQKEAGEPKKKAGKSVVEKLQQKKITELKTAIGINEKFQFINQLFEGNMKEYNVAIDQVNSFNSYSEAESYISDLKRIYKWNEDEPAALNFIELVQRRFL